MSCSAVGYQVRNVQHQRQSLARSEDQASVVAHAGRAFSQLHICTLPNPGGLSLKEGL